MSTAVFIVGDVHGHLEKLVTVLRDAGLIDAGRSWTGGDSTLWLMGDLVDHGPDGVGAIALAMTLQEQARRAGGRAEVLLGNHDVLLLAARRFGTHPIPDPDGTFRGHWEASGGVAGDLERLTDEQTDWLATRPAMARWGDHLLVHADARLYPHYGRSIAEVNHTLAELLSGDDAEGWYRLLDAFGEHQAFVGSEQGAAHVAALLDCFGGGQIVHGHTPVTTMTGQPGEAVREPLLYAGGRCLDVDPGLYLGGDGFVYRLPDTV
jgi:hypothetical protein